MRLFRIVVSFCLTLKQWYLISRGVLRVLDLIDESTWSVVLSDACRGPKKLRAPHWSALLATLRQLARAWEGHLPVQGSRVGLEWRMVFTSHLSHTLLLLRFRWIAAKRRRSGGPFTGYAFLPKT